MLLFWGGTQPPLHCSHAPEAAQGQTLHLLAERMHRGCKAPWEMPLQLAQNHLQMLVRLQVRAGQSNALERATVIGAQVRVTLRAALTCSTSPGSPRTQPYSPGLCTRDSLGAARSAGEPQRSAGAMPMPRTASSPAHRRLQGSQPGQPVAASASKGRKVLMEPKWRHPKMPASV